MTKLIVGWREWCSLPALGLPAIKAKIDTGARTSALHAFDIEVIEISDKPYAKFYVQPFKNNDQVIKLCTAPLLGRKIVTDSGAHQELRLVIQSNLILANQTHQIELTLTDRGEMNHMLLIGRKALENKFLVDTSKTFVFGKMTTAQLRKYYIIK